MPAGYNPYGAYGSYGVSVPAGYGVPGYGAYAAGAGAGASPASSFSPSTRELSTEEATRRAEERVSYNRPFLNDGLLEGVARFVGKHGLPDEVETGLRMLRIDSLRYLLEDATIQRRISAASDKIAAVLQELSYLDPEAEAVVRKLSERRQRREGHSKRHEADGSTRPHRSHRHRHEADGTERRSRKRRRDAPSRDGSGNEGRAPVPAAKEDHDDFGGPPYDPDGAASGKRKIRAVTKAHPSSNRAPSSHRGAAGVDEIEQWLTQLDEGRGVLMQYCDRMRREYSGSLAQVAATLIADPSEGKSVLSCIDPTFFKVLGVESLGHRLLLARGIAALADS